MAINFDYVYKVRGEEATDADGSPLTLRKVAVRALFQSYDDEKNIKGEEKFKRGMLGMRIEEEVDPELKVDEVNLVKTLIGKYSPPLVVAQSWKQLDPNS